MPMIFNNKTVIITGASEGVGAATARLFAEAGANLMLVARTKKKLESIADELRDKTKVEIYAMDVADEDACVNVFKKADFEYGRIDVLVNNAGFHQRGTVDSVSADDLGRMIDVNLRAPIMLTRIALPYIRDAGGGAVINVGSLAGRTPVPGSAVYSASKAGLRTFTYAIAEEMTKAKIKFAVVSPGPIDTGFIMSDIDAVSDLTFSQPISTAEEVAQAVLDLCGNDQIEQSMPAISGWLTTMTYLFPWLGRKARPMLEKKGKRTKAKLKAEAKKKKEAAREKEADDEDQKPK
ncbi:MAG: SDR family NAD(P)-dependent oxidoreductase [Woeseiaceae bacterium]|nr:SDR family NAD(P)-dependent oxidoreductase [Woeseiaceae bacterium]